VTSPGKPTSDHLPDWTPQILENLSFPLGWKDGCPDPQGWKDRGLKAFRSLLLEDDGPLDASAAVMEQEERAGYRVTRLELTLGRFRRTGALLAVPEGSGPFPAALVLHDHGALFTLGKEKVIRPLRGHRLTGQARDWADKNYGGLFIGDELALRGWVVLATDAYGWGDRACAGYEAQQALACNLLGLGSSWAGVIAVEDAAAARWLGTLDSVDPRRVAAVGHSMGAFRSWQVNALSDHIRASVAVGSFGTVAGLMVAGGNRVRGQSAYSMTHPGLARVLDFPDVAALGAPKPLLMIHGTQDPLCPASTVQEAYKKTSSAYAGFGFSGAFRGEFREGGHLFTTEDQEKAWKWLDEVLPPKSGSSLLS